MFYGCTSLTTAPELPATTLVNGCYQSMFYNCSNLSYIKALFLNGGQNFTLGWAHGVASTGTFVKNAAATWSISGENGVPSGWNIEYSDYTEFNPTISLSPSQYVTFESGADSSVFGLTIKSTNQTIYISKNGTLWQNINAGDVFLLDENEYFYVCGLLTNNNTTSNYTQFIINGNILASGNCGAIWNYENPSASLKEYCGYHMFYGCTGLVSAPELLATTLAAGCYNYMFYGCTNLMDLPLVPTTPNNTYYGYDYMFQGCTSLISITIEASVTSVGSYAFQGCSNLTSMYLYPTTPPTIQSTTFKNVPSTCAIYVPVGCAETYKAASNWSSRKNYIVEMS